MTMVETLGWVLLHFAWQGAIVAGALWMALLLTPSRSASLRYALGCAALLVIAMAPLATAMRLTTPHVEPITAQLREGDVAANAGPGDIALEARHGKTSTFVPTVGASMRWVTRRSTIDRMETALPWLVAGWAFGVVLLSVRLLGGWWRTRRLRTEGLSPVPPWCVDTIARLTARLRITRPISFAVSLSIPVPVVIGHVTPLVLLPVAVLSGLSPRQLEAILAHELAHVRRHDYLVNLIQTVIETLLFYHPAVWWVSSQLRVLREHCCDDLAVAACGDRKGYVQALLGLEQLWRQSPLLALGATDGPLVERARRVLRQGDREVAAPRLAAGAIALTVAVLAIAGVSTASQEPALSGAPNRLSQTVAPVPVVAVSPQSGSLEDRWAWSDREARSRRTSRYWVGYSFRPLRGLPPLVYFDRDVKVAGNGMYFSGHILGSERNLIFPGRPLDIPGTDASAIKVLFALDAGGGTPRLTRVHVSAVPLPIDLTNLPVFWLGAADTAESLEHVDNLYSRASTADLKKDLVATLAIHDDSVRVVAWLERRLAGADPDEIRADAAEWLAHHPIKAALVALDRTARTDRSSRVRQEAAEALGDLNMPGATTTLIRLARTAQDLDVRREAVEALGARADLSASDALGDIARQDPNRDVQREAVETLGDYDDQRGVPLLLDIARTHPEKEVRQEAIETLGDALPSEAAVPLLDRIAREDKDTDIQREAVDALSGISEKNSGSTLMELAQSHPNTDVRREALEALAQSAPSEAVAVLRRAIESDRDVEVRRDAVERLAELGDPRARTTLVELARSHKDVEVRVQAVESLGDAPSAADTADVLAGIVQRDAAERVREEALETLADLPKGQGIAALVEIARSHADPQIRKLALESLLDSDHPEARKLFQRALERR
jgi:HEAT repeat protein/beta-lactamase regulating signal transducer with metallopeptidase domain